VGGKILTEQLFCHRPSSLAAAAVAALRSGSFRFVLGPAFPNRQPCRVNGMDVVLVTVALVDPVSHRPQHPEGFQDLGFAQGQPVQDYGGNPSRPRELHQGFPVELLELVVVSKVHLVSEPGNQKGDGPPLAGLDLENDLLPVVGQKLRLVVSVVAVEIVVGEKGGVAEPYHGVGVQPLDDRSAQPNFQVAEGGQGKDATRGLIIVDLVVVVVVVVGGFGFCFCFGFIDIVDIVKHDLETPTPVGGIAVPKGALAVDRRAPLAGDLYLESLINEPLECFQLGHHLDHGPIFQDGGNKGC
jgi:hypothetical protein